MSSSVGNVGLLVDRLRDLRRRLVAEGIEEAVMRATSLSVLSTVPLLPASDAMDWRSIFAGEKVIVMLPDNSFVYVRYSPGMTIQKLKTEVERQVGHPRGMQVLYLNSSKEQMVDQYTLESYGIRADSMVYVVDVHYLLGHDGIMRFGGI